MFQAFIGVTLAPAINWRLSVDPPSLVVDSLPPPARLSEIPRYGCAVLYRNRELVLVLAPLDVSMRPLYMRVLSSPVRGVALRVALYERELFWVEADFDSPNATLAMTVKIRLSLWLKLRLLEMEYLVEPDALAVEIKKEKEW